MANNENLREDAFFKSVEDKAASTSQQEQAKMEKEMEAKWEAGVKAYKERVRKENLKRKLKTIFSGIISTLFYFAIGVGFYAVSVYGQMNEILGVALFVFFGAMAGFKAGVVWNKVSRG